MSPTTGQVWSEIEKHMFAVVAMVTAKAEGRSAGIVYRVENRKLYFGTAATEWKTRHIAANPNVSVTIPVVRIPLVPMSKIPPATITFSATARVLDAADTPPGVVAAIQKGLPDDPERQANAAFVEVTPRGQFVTFGIGIPIHKLRDLDRARGRVSVD